MKIFTDIIIIFAVAVMVIAIVFYLRNQKKQGVACVGCPYAKECSKNKCSCSSCSQNNKE